jgi:hypothetical protein
LDQSSVVNKVSQLHDHVVNFVFIILEIIGRVQDEHLLAVMVLKPILVLNVNLFQVFQRNRVFLRSHPLLGPFETLLRAASQVNDLGLFL